MRTQKTRTVLAIAVAVGLVTAGCASGSSSGAPTTYVDCVPAAIDSYWDVLARTDVVARGTLVRIAEDTVEQGIVWEVDLTVLMGDEELEIGQIARFEGGPCPPPEYGAGEFKQGREGLFFLWDNTKRGYRDRSAAWVLPADSFAVFYDLDELEEVIGKTDFPIVSSAIGSLTEELGPLPIGRFTPPGFRDSQ
jgi:hypothetical protein